MIAIRHKCIWLGGAAGSAHERGRGSKQYLTGAHPPVTRFYVYV